MSATYTVEVHVGCMVAAEAAEAAFTAAWAALVEHASARRLASPTKRVAYFRVTFASDAEIASVVKAAERAACRHGSANAFVVRKPIAK